jgi:ERCC4-type nuclease
MTVFVDDRTGSKELFRPLKRAGCSVKLTRLEFGDVTIPINGPQGELTVAVERKKVDEMVGAIMDPRFTSRQLPGLLTRFPLSYLVIEGGYRQGPQGELLVGWGREAGFTRQRFLYDSFEHFLLSIEIQTTLSHAGRLRVKRTQSLYETVSFLAALASWGRKRWQDHGSFKVVDEAIGPKTAKRIVKAIRERA